MTEESWRPTLRRHVGTLDWQGGANDVRPFLENPDDAALVDANTALRLLS